jgi:hypothetical protein
MLRCEPYKPTPVAAGPTPIEGVSMRAALSILFLACTLAATAAAAAPATTDAPATPGAPAAATPGAAPPAAKPSDDVLRQKIVGSWGRSVTCDDGRLTFNADGSFTSGGGNPDNAVSGTYAIADGRLTGENGDNTMPDMLVDFDGDALLLDDGSGNPERLSRCQAAQ